MLLPARSSVRTLSAVVLPAGAGHQLVNTGDAPLELVGIFGATPVLTWDVAGQELSLPWRT